eukprot:Skav230163  [mRNA]  locus=scaffold996:123382:133082:- [translate_table: standard]
MIPIWQRVWINREFCDLQQVGRGGFGKETVDDNHTNWSGPEVFQQLQQMRSSKVLRYARRWTELPQDLPDAWSHFMQSPRSAPHRDAKWWPWALRYANEIYRCVRLDRTPDWPPFLHPVKIRKRTWRRGSFDPVVDSVMYLCPSAEEHGHWTVKEDEVPRVTRCLMKRTVEPLDESIWVALEREIPDEHTARRRLREKPAIRRARRMTDPHEEDEDEEQRRRIQRLIQQETRKMVEDDFEMATEEAKILSKLRKMSVNPEEEDVLQTRVVSPKEVAENWHLWEPPLREEMNSLLTEKGALKELSPEERAEFEERMRSQKKKIEYVPSKLVCTRKPGKAGGKKKVRWVVCGNFEERRDDEETYSGGADSAAFRIMIWAAARLQWVGITLDIKTAFLNAFLDMTDDEVIILIRPPSLMTEKKVVKRGVMYLPTKAVYGLRRSPRLWGRHRDATMQGFRIRLKRQEGEEVLILVQLDSEPNLWKVVCEEEAEGSYPTLENGQVRGLVMTYVDDIFIVGSEETARAVRDEFQRTWSVSKPEEVGVDPVRFLGMEVKIQENEKGRKSWMISQESYIKDLVERYEDLKERKVPITREQALMERDSHEVTPEDVRTCQRLVGEVLWTVTRTRPDLMYACARMGANVTKATTSVKETARQVMGYMRRTAEEGLRFEDDGSQDPVLQMYSDASFAPDGEESHGSYIVLLQGNLLFWRSGRQTTVSLSTAEAELKEVVEGMVATDAVGIIAEEISERITKMGVTDSQAALAILTTESGSWRTRHLRMRSNYARQMIEEGVWNLTFVPGEKMIADVGTKALSAVRLETLKGLMSMKGPMKKPEEEKEVEEAPMKEVKTDLSKMEKAAKLIQLLIIAAKIQEVKGQGRDEADEGSSTLWWMMVAYTVMVILVTVMIQQMWRKGIGRLLKLRGELKESEEVEGEDERKERSKTGKGKTKTGRNKKPEVLSFPGSEKEPLGVFTSPQKEDPRSRARDYHREEKSQAASSNESQTSSKPTSTAQKKEEREDPKETPVQATQQEEVGLPFEVMMTSYGQVYHSKRGCNYLTQPQTRFISVMTWCSECQRRASRKRRMPKNGEMIYVHNLHEPFHTERDCPVRDGAHGRKGCTNCTG